MKPTVPETGRVIKTEGDMAVVLMRGSESCKGCGAAAIGLCKASGLTATVTVKNTRHAVQGDTVTVDLEKRIQRTGFFLAYGIPLLAFLGGSLLGHVAGSALALPWLDIAAGFSSLLASGAFSYGKLKKMDSTSSLTIREIVSKTSSRS